MLLTSRCSVDWGSPHAVLWELASAETALAHCRPRSLRCSFVQEPERSRELPAPCRAGCVRLEPLDTREPAAAARVSVGFRVSCGQSRDRSWRLELTPRQANTIAAAITTRLGPRHPARHRPPGMARRPLPPHLLGGVPAAGGGRGRGPRVPPLLRLAARPRTAAAAGGGRRRLPVGPRAAGASSWRSSGTSRSSRSSRLAAQVPQWWASARALLEDELPRGHRSCSSRRA